MSAVGYTPIQLYYSTTASVAPAAGNLSSGELAINITDGILFYKDNAGAVQTLATKAATSGTYSSITLSGGTANGVAYLNGSKVVTTGTALTFDGTNLGIGGTGQLRFSTSGGAVGDNWIQTTNSYDLTLYCGRGSTTQYNLSLDYFKWAIGGSEQMRLTSTGLGIGTSSPSAKLGVAGSGGGQLYIDYAAGGNNYYNATTHIFQSNTGTTEWMRLVSGNLGLGVTPTTQQGNYRTLQIGNGSSLRYSIFGQRIAGSAETFIGWNAYGFGNTGSIGTGFYYGNTGDAATMYSQNSQHTWFIAPSGTAGTAITFTQAMTLDASGNWLVGTTTNANSTRGVIGWSSAFQYGLTLDDSYTGAAGATAVYFRRNGSNVGSITTTTTGTLYNITSDYRLKEVIGTVSGSGERIDALQPIDYEWKADGSRTRGFLAHKFQEVYPNSVSGEKDAVDADGKPVYQTMQASTSEVIADLVAEIQSLRKRLAAAGI